MNMRTIALVGVLGCGIAVSPAEAQVTKTSVPGIVNFSSVESTVACAGATTPAAMAEVKRRGFASVVNLRQASEKGADIEAGTAAAQAAGLHYIHLPFNSTSPDPTLIDRFLAAVTDPGNQPAFIHCASANRAAALWMVKRVQVDDWAIDRAATEAAELGLRSPALKMLALNYIEAHKK